MIPKALPPFLKWAGGKYRAREWLCNELEQELQKRPRYVEPFVGSGAILLELLRRGALNGKTVNLYDGCRGLIDTWQAVTAKDSEVIDAAVNMTKGWISSIVNAATEAEAELVYQNLRAMPLVARYSDPAISTAYFLTMNWSCFNGMHRENKKGEFSTPIGRNSKNSARDYIRPRFDQLYAVREFFQIARAQLGVEFAFRYSLHQKAYARELYEDQTQHTTYYADPPYMSDDDSVQYIAAGFAMQDHIDLRNFSLAVWQSGGAIYQTNADVNDVHRLYRNFNQVRTIEEESISAKGVRGGRGRLLIKELKT